MKGPNKGGYWPSWENAVFPPDQIQAQFFTHVYYAFVNPKASPCKLEIDDPDPKATTFELEIDDPRLLRNFTDTLYREHPQVKRMLSIGGAEEALKEIFSSMSETSESRRSFIGSTIEVARDYAFDGLDFDWEFPNNQPNDMGNFKLLLYEWREAVDKEARSNDKPPLLLSAATYYKPELPEWQVGVHTYPVEAINRNLDWINAMCYDYNGKWTPNNTGTLAALNGDISTSRGLQAWIDAGINREKLVMGLPLYGRTWTLEDEAVNGIGAPANGVGLRGDEDGVMSYNQVQQFISQENATVKFDDATESYYSYSGTEWISYDNDESIQSKIRHALGLNIGGYFFWAINCAEQRGILELASQTWNN